VCARSAQKKTSSMTEMPPQTHLTHIPLNEEIPGQLYRWSLPTPSDGSVREIASRRSVTLVAVFSVKNMKQVGVTHVLACCSSAELRHVKSLYDENGFKVIHIEIQDFGVPSMDEAKEGIEAAEEALRAGGIVLAHCRGGCGRTGTVLACVVGDLLDKNCRDSIAYLRMYFPAVETGAQASFVAQYLTMQDEAKNPQSGGVGVAIPASS
jgi:hypothetical protein